jgi:hypothetical protein
MPSSTSSESPREKSKSDGRKVKSKKQNSKKHKSGEKQKHKREKCPDFPLCTTTPVNSGTIPIFGTTTTLRVPLSLSLLAAGTGIIVSGTCAAPVVSVALSTTVAITFTCAAGVCTATVTTPGALTPLTDILTFAGVPIIGAAVGTISSSAPVTAGVSVRSAGCNTAVVSGTLAETISFTGTADPISATELAPLVAAILAFLTGATSSISCCLATILAAVGFLPAAVLTLITTLFPTLAAAGSTVGELIALVVAALTPSLAAQIAALLDTAAISVPVTLAVPAFPFSLTLTDPALGRVKKCDQLCATASATFVSAAGVAFTPPVTVFTVTPSACCLDVALAPFTVDALADLGLTTPIPAVFCASLIPGSPPCMSCIPLSAAIVKTDNVTACINHGAACFCPTSTANVASGASSFPSFPTFQSGGCSTCF